MKILVYAANCHPYHGFCAIQVLDDGTRLYGFACTDNNGKHHFSLGVVQLEKRLIGEYNRWTDVMVRKVYLKNEDITTHLNLSYHKTWVVPFGFSIVFENPEEMTVEELLEWRKA